MCTHYNQILRETLLKFKANEDLMFLSECFEHKVAFRKFRRAFSELYGDQYKNHYIIYMYNGEVLDIKGFNDNDEFQEACKCLAETY